MPNTETSGAVVVAALYRFAPFEHPEVHQRSLQEACAEHDVFGTLLLAPEGINGTIAGSRSGIDKVIEVIRALPGCAGLEHKESFAAKMPFLRMRVRLKKEIVTMGVPGIDPNRVVGDYVDPADWNDLISDPDVVVIDTRNDYEVEIGTFKGAVNPRTVAFRDFPDWFRRTYKNAGDQKFAMFCTGGIRCEKATSFLKSEGIDQVFHLNGGILKYLETTPPEKSLWEGECFVFDQRTAVTHGLDIGSYELCHACRHPIDESDRKSKFFVPGVSCPRCHDTHTLEQKARFSERQKQMRHAARTGVKHLGATQGKQRLKVPLDREAKSEK